MYLTKGCILQECSSGEALKHCTEQSNEVGSFVFFLVTEGQRHICRKYIDPSVALCGINRAVVVLERGGTPLWQIVWSRNGAPVSVVGHRRNANTVAFQQIRQDCLIVVYCLTALCVNKQIHRTPVAIFSLLCRALERSGAERAVLPLRIKAHFCDLRSPLRARSTTCRSALRCAALVLRSFFRLLLTVLLT